MVTAQDWIDKSETAFGKQTVNGIPEWVREVGDPRLTFRRGAEDYIYIDGKKQVNWYFAPGWVTFFLHAHTPSELSELRRRLSHPEHLNPKGKGGAITFRAYSDRDLDVLKDILLVRLGRRAESPTEEQHTPTVAASPVNAATQVLATDPVSDIDASDPLDEIEDEFEGDEEGREAYRLHRTYERSPKNRAEAIRRHGTSCKACGFNFNHVYGADLAKQFIEIHHIRPLSTFTGHVNPQTDLVPLCSNCHRMIHRGGSTVLTVDELRNRIRKNRSV